MAKKTIKPVITGIHPVGGKKKYLALHYHPDAIREHIKNLAIMSKDEPSLQMLFEDVAVLVSWALDRLPLAAPPKEEGMQQEATSQPE